MLKDKEKCYMQFSMGYKALWESMHGPDKEKAEKTLLGVFGKDQLDVFDGKGGRYQHYKYNFNRAEECYAEAEAIRTTCRYEKQNFKNIQIEKRAKAKEQYRRDVVAMKNKYDEEQYNQLVEINKLLRQ